MNLELTDEQEFFRATTRKFLDGEVPVSGLRDLYEDPIGFDPSWWRRGAELGWTSLFIGEEQGGGTLSGKAVSDAVIVAEEMGRSVSPGPFLPVSVVAAAVSEHGSAQLQQEALPKLLSGEAIASWAFCESGSPWDAHTIGSRARVESGEVLLDGQKAYVEAAAISSHFLVTAYSPEGLTQVVVPASAPGVRVSPGRSVDMTRRFGSVTFESVRVPTAYMLGRPGGAAEMVERQLSIAIALQCAEMVGLAERTMDFTLEYGRERFAFGRPIVSFQALKHRIADLTVRLEGSKAVTDELATSLDDRDPGSRILASVAKAYVGGSCLDIIDDCVQITGGIGVTWEHDIHIYNRRAVVDLAVLGTPEEHKARLVRMLSEEAA